jgi:hypothetical protein
VSLLGDLGEVVTFNVNQLAGSSTAFFCPSFGDYLGYQIYVLRRLWRRQGRGLATLEYRRESGTWSGCRVVVDLETGRALKPIVEDRHSALYLQVSFWRKDGLIRVGPQGADPITSKQLDLTELRRMAGIP